MSDLLKVPDLAGYLGVRPATLQDWRYRGLGPKYLKIGNRVRYRAADVETWISTLSP